MTALRSLACAAALSIGVAFADDGAALFRAEVEYTAHEAGLKLGADTGLAAGWSLRGSTQEQLNKMAMSKVVMDCMGKSSAHAFGSPALRACEKAQVATPPVK